jgi:hypothetical protein
MIENMTRLPRDKSIEHEADRRAAWKANFPYEPTFHSSAKFDPDIYDPSNPSKNRKPGDKLWETHRRMVNDHGYLKAFFENEHIYSKEFEQLYGIMNEYGRAKNPVVLGGVFMNLKDYHSALQHDPDSLFYYERVEMPPVRDNSGELKKTRIPVDGKTTWGEHALSLRESIATRLYSPRINPGAPQLESDESWDMADRIINEIPYQGFLEIPENENFSNHDDLLLSQGDPLLVPYEGYVEDYQDWDIENDRQLSSERLENIPGSLQISEDGKIYDPDTGKEYFKNAVVSRIREGKLEPIVSDGPTK